MGQLIRLLCSGSSFISWAMVNAILLFGRAGCTSLKAFRTQSRNHNSDMVIYTILCGDYRKDTLCSWNQALLDSWYVDDCLYVNTCESFRLIRYKGSKNSCHSGWTYADVQSCAILSDISSGCNCNDLYHKVCKQNFENFEHWFRDVLLIRILLGLLNSRYLSMVLSWSWIFMDIPDPGFNCWVLHLNSSMLGM